MLWKTSIELSATVDTVTLKRSFITVGVLSQLILPVSLCYYFLSDATFPYQSKVGARGGGGRGCFMSSVC